MRRVFAVLVFLFAGIQFLTAQTPGHTETKYVSFGKIRKDKRGAGNIAFSGVRAVDNRLDKACIGNLFSGRSVVRYNFENGFSQVNHFLNTTYQDRFNRQGDSLLLLINDFGITTSLRTTHADNGEVQVKRYHVVRVKTTLARLSEGRIKPMGAYDTLWVFQPPQSGRYEISVKRALRNIVLYADFLAGSNSPTESGGKRTDGPGAGSTPGTAGSLGEGEFRMHYQRRDMRGYAILSDSVLRKGVYHDFHQFLENSPEPGIGSLAGADAEMTGYEELDSSALWGYCDGEVIYVNTKSPAGFYPVSRDGYLYSLSATNNLKPRTHKHGPTVVTIVTAVAVVALLVAVICITKNSSGSSHSSGTSRGGSGSATIGSRNGPRPGSPAGAGTTGGTGGSASGVHHGGNYSNFDIGPFSGSPDVSVSGQIFFLPQILVDYDHSVYHVPASRIDMETGELEF